MERKDQYKLNLKSLTTGHHSYRYTLSDAFWLSEECNPILGGEVEVQVALEVNASMYVLHLLCEGQVRCACDRCLGEVEIAVSSERELVIKLGEEFAYDGEDVLTLPEQERVLDLAPLMLEELALSLPLQRLHPDGECDKEVYEYYQQMLVGEVVEEDTESAGEPRDSEEPVDQRWLALKQWKEKNEN